jgi:aspartyl/asparaginyl beta-hydroxylase (cupin superfamily)
MASWGMTAPKTFSDRSPASLNGQATAALRAGDWRGAARWFEEATKLDPASTALQRNLASAYRAGGDDAGEQRALQAALDLDRRDLIAWVRLAELHERRGVSGEALASWHAALALSAGAQALPPALVQALAHGRAYAEAAAAHIRTAAEEALGPVVGGADETAARRVRAMVDHALGNRPLYINQCAGLRYPFLPAYEFFDRRHFSWFEALEARTDAIRGELHRLLADPGNALRPYVRMDKGVGDNPWSGLDGSLDWGACFLWEYGEPNQAVLDRCPATAAALAAIPAASIPGRSPSAFFSLLKPGARIPPHTGVTNTRAIVHLALDVPAGCGFRVGGETRSWEEGRAFAFDDTIEHEAWNDGQMMRAVLILDTWNPHLSQTERDAIVNYYAAADATGYGPAKGSG